MTKIDWKRHAKRRRRAVVCYVVVFVLGFSVTVAGELAWASGVRPLQWFDQQRSQPLAGDVRVIVGDTIRVGEERIRIVGIDTAEMPPRSNCAVEALMALKAKENLERLVASGREFAFVPNLGRERDVYGRLLGDVLIDGQDVGRAQLDAGLAQIWAGRHAIWC